MSPRLDMSATSSSSSPDVSKVEQDDERIETAAHRASPRVAELLRVAGYGLSCWFVPFAVAMVLYPLRMTRRPLFESVLSIVLAATVVGVMTAYMARKTSVSLERGIICGLVWLGESLVLDWIAFSIGPMQIGLVDYIEDIGLTYLMIPLLTVGLAWQVRRGGAGS